MLDIAESIKSRRESSAQPTREEEERLISKQKKNQRKRQMKNDVNVKNKCQTSESEDDVYNPIERITVDMGAKEIDYVYRRVVEMESKEYSLLRSNFDRLLIMDYAWTAKNRDHLYTQSRIGVSRVSKHMRCKYDYIPEGSWRAHGNYRGNFYNTEKAQDGDW